MAVTITLRSAKGSALTSTEVDTNFSNLKAFAEGLETKLGAKLNEDGSLKDGAVNSSDAVAGNIITLDHLKSLDSSDAGKVMRVGADGRLTVSEQTIAFHAGKSGSAQEYTSADAGEYVAITFPTVLLDTGSGFSEGVYTVPRSGIYLIGAALHVQHHSGTPEDSWSYYIGLTKNGSFVAVNSLGMVNETNGQMMPSLTRVMALQAGDVLGVSFRVADTGDASFIVAANADNTVFFGAQLG